MCSIVDGTHPMRPKDPTMMGLSDPLWDLQDCWNRDRSLWSWMKDIEVQVSNTTAWWETLMPSCCLVPFPHCPQESSPSSNPGTSLPLLYPTPIFLLNASMACSMSSTHYNTKCLPNKWVYWSELKVFSTSCFKENLRKVKLCEQWSNFLGRQTDLSCPWALCVKAGEEIKLCRGKNQTRNHVPKEYQKPGCSLG